MGDSQLLQQAAKYSSDGNTALARENYNEAMKCFKQAANCYEKEIARTSDDKSKETLLLLKQSFDRSFDWVQQRKSLEPYKQRITEITTEKSRPPEANKFFKIPSKVFLQS